MRLVVLTLIIGIVLMGAYGAMSAHGEEARVTTSVSVVMDNSTVTQVAQGDTVKIHITVENNGDSVYSFSSVTPASAYANIYTVNNGQKVFVEKVRFIPRIVSYHVIYLNPGEKYSTYVSWTVPTNITGEVEIDAWAASAPAGTVDVRVIGTHSAAQGARLSVSTDAQGYDVGETVYIYVENDGNSTVVVGEGFEIYDEYGDEVVNASWSENANIQPGQTLVYYWNIPSYMPSGWYYVHPYGTNQYVEIYIF